MQKLTTKELLTLTDEAIRHLKNAASTLNSGDHKISSSDPLGVVLDQVYTALNILECDIAGSLDEELSKNSI